MWFFTVSGVSCIEVVESEIGKVGSGGELKRFGSGVVDRKFSSSYNNIRYNRLNRGLSFSSYIFSGLLLSFSA